MDVPWVVWGRKGGNIEGEKSCSRASAVVYASEDWYEAWISQFVVCGVQFDWGDSCSWGMPHVSWSAILVGRLSTCCSNDDRHEWYSSSARSSEVKELILESVNPWKNNKVRVSWRGGQGAHATRSAHATTNVYSQLWGLEDVGFHGFLRNDWIPEGDGQVASGSASLPDPVVLETENRGRCSKESRVSVMFLKHWVSIIVTLECLSRNCLQLLHNKHWKGNWLQASLHTRSILGWRRVWWRAWKRWRVCASQSCSQINLRGTLRWYFPWDLIGNSDSETMKVESARWRVQEDVWFS